MIREREAKNNDGLWDLWAAIVLVVIIPLLGVGAMLLGIRVIRTIQTRPQPCVESVEIRTVMDNPFSCPAGADLDVMPVPTGILVKCLCHRKDSSDAHDQDR